jgi:3-oxoacyl-[acyl-carrier protein] reductase
MASLAGRVAIVTGSSQGIGRAIAERLARDGATVAVNHLHHPEDAAEVVRGIESAGGQAFEVGANVADRDELDQLFKTVADRAGRLDILVNNAGLGATAALADITEEHVDKLLGVNVKAVLFASQLAAAAFGENGGRIISLASTVAESPPAGTSVYAASKAAVVAITQSLAQELGSRGITVNAVAPGAADTSMLHGMQPDEVVKYAVSRTALGRLGQPEDIANAVALLASDDARFITGRVLVVDGGLRL